MDECCSQFAVVVLVVMMFSLILAPQEANTSDRQHEKEKANSSEGKACGKSERCHEKVSKRNHTKAGGR